jgi:two-component system cell cycle response regulator DivK
MPRILIVDDKISSRELLRSILEKEGHQVTEAGDGLEALAKARTETPDMILLDLHMPHRNGYEVVAELRTEKRFLTTPIVAVTASAMLADRERVLAAGFDGYLTKPVPLNILRAEIERLLKK